MKIESLDKHSFVRRMVVVERVVGSLIAASVIAYSLAGCAMSQQAFGKLAAGVAERNEQRYRTAEVELRARGYIFVDEDLYATLAEEARERCLAVSRGHVAGMPTNASEPVLVRVVAATRAGSSAPVPTDLSVAARDACQFFTARTNQLDGQRPDGSAARIIRIGNDLRLARDRHGNLVVVAMSPRVVSRRSVLVERSCDHMPHPEPGPLDRKISTRVIWASAPPSRVEMVVEEEVLEVKCTKNTH